MPKRNYATEVEADLRAGDFPNLATASRAAAEIDRLSTIIAKAEGRS